MHGQHSRPLWVGILACTALPVVLFAAQAYFSPYQFMIPSELVAMSALVGALFSSLCIALPYILWLRRKRLLNALRVCLAGAVGGAVVLGAFAFYMAYFPEMQDRGFALATATRSAASVALSGALVGVLSGVALCVGAGIPFRPTRANVTQ